MENSLEPFGSDPIGLQPGWADPAAGGRLLYYGRRGAASAFDELAGFSQAGADIVTAVVPVDDSGQIFFGLRTVSGAGVLERNTHVVCGVARRKDGEFQMVLPRPTDAAIVQSADGARRLVWRLAIRPGEAKPDRTAVLRRFNGEWADCALLSALPGRSVYEWILPPGEVGEYAIESRLGEQVGPRVVVEIFWNIEQPQAPRLL